MEELKELIYAFAEQNVACFLPGFQNIKSFGCYKYTKVYNHYKCAIKKVVTF